METPAQLARVDDLLNVLDGFLRRADAIDRLADYLHATGRDQPQPRAQLATGDTLARQLER